MSDTQRLPNLYQLLGLPGPESNREKIVAALKRAQAKVENLKADSARASDAARLQKVIALGQKYLLPVEQKAAYDAQWIVAYGSATKPTSAAVPTTVAAVVATAATPTLSSTTSSTTSSTIPASTPPAIAPKLVPDELQWDMSSLDALLPSADPHAPFQMAEVLRSSQVRDPLAAEADLRKLIELLGGELAPASQPVVSQPIDLSYAATSAGVANVEPPPAIHVGTDAVAEEADTSLGIAIPRSSNSSAGAALAKRMRLKKQRAILFGGAGLAAAIGGLALLGFYLNQPAPKSDNALAQASTPTRTEPPVVKGENAGQVKPDVPAPDNKSSLPPVPGLGSDLIQPGENVKPLEIQARPLKPDEMSAMPDMAKPDMSKPDMSKPDMAKPEAMQPDMAKPVEPTKPEPTKPAEPTPEPTTPEATKPAEPAADAKLTPKDKKAWQEEMKRIRMGLSKLDPVASEKQITDATPMAKTAQQRSQLATLEQAVGLIRKAREAIVAGIGGLESAQTFKVGKSTEVAFVEGDDTHLVVRLSGSRQEYRLDGIPPAMALAIMKLKPNVVDANLDAAMGVYIMVQPKKNSNLIKEGKELLEGAAGAGAISKELSQFHEEDYSLK